MPQLLRALHACLLAFLLAPWAACAAAPLLVLDRQEESLSLAGRAEYWIDDSGALTHLQVAARADGLPWQPVRAGARYPIHDKSLWLRFRAVVPDDERWYMVLPYSGIDRAAFYVRGRDGGWSVQEAGDATPVADWPLPGRLPTFTLADTRRGEPVDYLLRLEHARVSLSVTPVLHARESLAAARDLEQSLQGAYFGLVIAMGLLALALAVAWREPLFALLALYVAALGVAQLAHLGLGAQYVWHAWPAFNRLSTFVLAPLAMASGLWLARALTLPRRSSRWLDRLTLWLAWALPGSALLDVLLQQPYSRALMGWLMLAALALIGALLAAAWRRGDDRYLPHIALACLPMLLATVAPLLSMLELQPASFLTRYGTSVAALLQMPTLLYALSLRSSSQRETLARQQAMATTDPLTGLALEHVLLLRLDATLKRAWKENQPFALIAVRVTNLPQIVAAGGQRAGERALVVTASGLRHRARAQDAVARVGGHEFALLLEAPVTPTEAQATLDELRRTLAQQAERLPPEQRPQVAIASSALPQDTLGARLELDRLLHKLAPPPLAAPAAPRASHAAVRPPAVSHLAVRPPGPRGHPG